MIFNITTSKIQNWHRLKKTQFKEVLILDCYPHINNIHFIVNGILYSFKFIANYFKYLKRLKLFLTSNFANYMRS